MCSNLKKTLAGLALLMIWNGAQAEPETMPAPGHDLHYVIALQGDQALVDIRADMLAALPQVIDQQMETALPGDQLAEATVVAAAH